MYPIALWVIDAQGLELRQDGIALDKFCDGFQPHQVADLIDGFDHGPIHGIFDHIFDEAAIDFQKIDRQILQIGKC